MKEQIKIVYYNNMINIDSTKICYSNILGLYKNGNGAGLQVNFDNKERKKEIIDICSDISELIYKLDEKLKENRSDNMEVTMFDKHIVTECPNCGDLIYSDIGESPCNSINYAIKEHIKFSNLCKKYFE